MKNKLRIFLAVLILIIVAFVTYAGLSISVWAKTITQKLPQDVANLVKKENVSYIKLENVSPYVQQAAIASQDQRFYTNYGVDPRGTLRAIYYSLTQSQRQGASTITEQLAKNVYYGDSDSLKTDIQTKILALFITQAYSKQQILEWYLNVIYFGKNSYGIENASQKFYKTNAKNLSVQQAAYLIALVNLPGYYSTHPVDAQNRAQLVLNSMSKVGYLK